jgi:hypothetical protein
VIPSAWFWREESAVSLNVDKAAVIVFDVVYVPL